jgi:hypothetical protein
MRGSAVCRGDHRTKTRLRLVTPVWSHIENALRSSPAAGIWTRRCSCEWRHTGRRRGGHLWWRQWSEPYELPHGYMVFTNGEFTDWVVYLNMLDEDLVDWHRTRCDMPANC